MAQIVKALVAPAQGKPFKLEDILIDPIRPDEALVEIHAVGVCHADLSCQQGKLPVKFPMVLGHEGAGIVKAVGAQVEEIRPGDAVLMSYNSCGNCTTCNRDAPAYCMNMLPLNFGGTRLDESHTARCVNGEKLYANFFGQSSFSSLAVVNKRCLVKVANNSPLELLAPLGCGLQTGAGAILKTLNMRPGASVAVFGTGAVGMAAIMAAKIQKAKTIIGIDIDEGRLAIARELGATHCLSGSAPDIVEQIRALCDGDGVEYAVDCTGVAVVIERMIQSLGTLGKAATIGAPAPGTTISVDVLLQLTKGRQYIGCNQGDSIPQKMIPYLIEQHKQGNFPIEKIVRNYKMEDYETALEDMKSGKTIKPVLVWGPRGS